MNTIPNYLNNSDLFEDDAVLIKQDQDESGNYLILDNTIFYPQGGGQPSDQGFIAINGSSIPIIQVRTVHNEVRHYYTAPLKSNNPGQKVHCTINKEKRIKHSQLHSAGHLLSNVMEQFYPEWMAIKGHHFSGEAYVEFKPRKSVIEINCSSIQEEMLRLISTNLSLESRFIPGNELSQYCSNLPYSIPDHDTIRLVRIGNFPFQPCGGTHIKYLNELKAVTLTKLKIKNERMKIHYDIA